MPRREILTAAERLQLLALPEDEGKLIRLYTLTKSDLAFVRQHRGNHNRLGIAVQMSYLQYPGRVLGEKEAPYEPILKLVSAELAIAPCAWELYAAREETRREHLADLLALSDKHRLVPGSLDHLLGARRRSDDVVSYTYATFSQHLGPSDVNRLDAIASAPGILNYLQSGPQRIERSSRETLKDWYATVRYRPERPMLYSSLVPRQVVDDVVRARGRFFQGMAPDVSSGLHILAARRTYVETNVTAVLTHFPSADTRWSNGASMSRGTEVANGFLQEFAGSPLGRLPPLT